jgi:hypothetical protein
MCTIDKDRTEGLLEHYYILVDQIIVHRFVNSVDMKLSSGNVENNSYFISYGIKRILAE